MSFFGNLLKLIAIGAFFVATGPFGLTVGKTLATVLRIGGVALSYLGALIDRPRMLNERQKISTSTVLDSGSPIPVVYGRAKVGAIVADWFLQPDNNSKELYYIAVFAHGSRDGLGVAGIDAMWFDQTPRIDLVAQAITSSSVANPTTITMAAAHGYVTGDRVWISGHSGSTPSLNGFFAGVTVTGATTFTIPVNVSVGGTGGTVIERRNKPFNPVTINYAAFLGTTTQNVGGTRLFTLGSGTGIEEPANVAGSGWSLTTDTGKGICCIGFVFVNIDVTDATGTVGPAFRGPPTIAAIIRGNRIYDPRTDVWTAGGDNPALCIRDYLLAPIYGCGFAATLINEVSFASAADYCDQNVTYNLAQATVVSSSVANPSVITTAAAHGYATGYVVRITGHTGSTPSINGTDYTITVTGATTFTIPVNVTVGGTGGTVARRVTIKRFTCNGVLDTAQPTSDNLQELLSACRGNLIWEQGQFKLTIRSDAAPAPTLALTPDNIIGQWSFRNAGLEEKWNLVKATYIEPANGEFKAQDVQWPPVTATNAYLASDNAFTNRLELALPFTNDQVMAQAICQVTLNEARLGLSAQVTCTEAALAASVGDLVTVTHPTPGWVAKQFWVTALQLMPDTTVAVSLQEYDPTAYALDTQEDRRTFPATTLDSIFTVTAPGTVTAAAISGGGLRITWVSANYGLIDYYEVQAKCTSCGDAYVTIARVRELTGGLAAIAPLARGGQTWDAQVRVVNVVGWPSAWVGSGPVTLPAPAGITPGVGAGTWTGFAPVIAIPTSPPVLTGQSRSAVGGDSCVDATAWIHTVGWTTTGADDVNFQIDLEGATDAAGTSFSVLVTGLTTVTSSYDNNTGVFVPVSADGSPTTTYYRKYKVKLIKKSDSSLVSSLTTSQGTLVAKSGSCPPI